MQLKKKSVFALFLGFIFFASLAMAQATLEKSPSLLRYDPKISFFEEYVRKYPKREKKILLYQQGFSFGDCGEIKAEDKFSENSDFFSAGVCNPPDDMGCSPRLWNCGTTIDVYALLYGMVKAHQCGYEKIGLYGHSRGGQSVIRLLDMLSSPEKHMNVFAQLGLSLEDANVLANKIAGVGLLHPWVDQTYPFKRFLEFLPFQSSLKRFYLGTFVLFLRLFTHFKLSTRDNHPFVLLQKLAADKKRTYPIHIVLAGRDAVVGNKYDKRIQDLMEAHPLLYVTKEAEYVGHNNASAEKSLCSRIFDHLKVQSSDSEDLFIF